MERVHPFGDDNVIVFADGHIERRPGSEWFRGNLFIRDGARRPNWKELQDMERLISGGEEKEDDGTTGS